MPLVWRNGCGPRPHPVLPWANPLSTIPDTSMYSPSVDEIPEDIKPLLRKYPSLGAAIKANDEDSLRKLAAYQLKTGKDPAELADEMSTALVRVVSNVSPSLALALIELGASVSASHEGYDVAQLSIKANNHALLETLIEKELVTVDHNEKDGSSLLMLALHEKKFDLADRLFDLGADIDLKTKTMRGGQTALHLAAANASFQGVLWLIEKGANPTFTNTEGHVACELIPALDAESKKEGWDLDAMYDALEDYREAFEERKAYEPSLRLREMAYLEQTPLSQQEAKEKVAQEAAAAQKAKEEEGLTAPKKKKLGF